VYFKIPLVSIFWTVKYIFWLKPGSLEYQFSVLFAKIQIMNDFTPAAEPNSEEPRKTSIILADDHPVVRKALRNDLEKEADFIVLAEASDGEEAVKLVSELNPDVVIMDIGMPKINGIQATRLIKDSYPDVIVLVLTVYDDVEHVLGILESGADGYLTKNILVEDIIKAVRSVVAGEMVLSPQVFQQVLKYALRHSTKPIRLDTGVKLTTRELEILQLIAKGTSNKGIANELGISSRTVKSHMVDIFRKLDVSSRTEAVITSLRIGFININDIG
jgi:NarL family two-component system response regulator LiaR